MKIYEKVIISALFVIFLGCSNPTEKFDGDYEPNIDETLKINTNLTPERIEADLQNFSINRGVIQCGKDVIREWRIIRSRLYGNTLIAHAILYIDREKSNFRAIGWEDLNHPANGNVFEEEITLEFTKEKLIFCHWLWAPQSSKVCSIFFRRKLEPNS